MRLASGIKMKRQHHLKHPRLGRPDAGVGVVGPAGSVATLSRQLTLVEGLEMGEWEKVGMGSSE